MYERNHVARASRLIYLLERKHTSVPDDLRYPRVIRKLETILLLIEMVDNRTTLAECGYPGDVYHRADRTFLIRKLGTALNESRDLIWGPKRAALSALGLDASVHNELVRSGFESVEEVRDASPSDLYVPKKFGPGKLQKLADAMLAHCGLIPASWRKELGLS